MQKPKNAWPHTPNGDALLFFAQLMREMLSTASFESFRVHSLDTTARLQEALTVVDDVQAQRLPPAALDPVLAELIWSLRRDPVAIDLAEKDILLFEEISKPNKRDLRLVSDAVTILHEKIENKYAEHIQNKIIYLFGAREKKDFRAAVAAYCCLLINSGYSKQFLNDLVQKKFFSNDLAKAGPGSIKTLFSQLARAPKKFRIAIAVDPTCSDFVGRLSGYEIIEFNRLPRHIALAFKDQSTFRSDHRYIVVSASGLDPVTAALKVEQYLTTMRSMTFLGRRSFVVDWSAVKYVTGLRSETGQFVTSDAIQFQTPVIPTPSRIKSIAKQTRQLSEKFDQASTERLFSSINTSALARATTSPENQLISLWSAVEILLSDPPPNTARISHYSNFLVPCICIKYVRRYIVAVCDGLVVSYRRQLKTILDSMPSDLGIDVYTRFTHLIFDERFEVQRAKLMAMCVGNPLARHRIWKLQQDFGTAKSISKSLHSHQNRVTWQVSRIYRARNGLVHAGRMPSYIDSIVMNAFEYYQSAIASILLFSSRRDVSNVDRVVGEIFLKYEIYKKEVSSISEDLVPPALYPQIYR